MLNVPVALLASRLPIPLRVSTGTLYFLNHAHRVIRGTKLWSSREFNSIRNSLVATLPTDRLLTPTSEVCSFTIIFVASSKDFHVLPFSISYAVKSLRKHLVKEVLIYVPEKDITFAQGLFSDEYHGVKVNVQSENSIFQFEETSAYFSKIFPGRGPWCSQQVLKLLAVKKVETEYALVVDADTILLNQRPWVRDDGNSLLIPSLEYHAQYYYVLRKIGLRLREPSVSFVSHHMAYRVSNVRSLLSELSIASVEDIISRLDFLDESMGPSPFCIDFELYGQSEYLTQRKHQDLGRWANISLSYKWFNTIMKRQFLVRILKLLFNSVSVHARSVN
jgi:hypothetical protein